MLLFQVAVLDTSSLSVLFLKDGVSSSPIISITWKELKHMDSVVKSLKHSETKIAVCPAQEVMFVLTKDAKINMIDGGTGHLISTRPWYLKKESVAISMYVIGKYNFLLETIRYLRFAFTYFRTLTFIALQLLGSLSLNRLMKHSWSPARILLPRLNSGPIVLQLALIHMKVNRTPLR